MNIKLHIESIVVDGIDLSPQQQAEFKISLQHELTQLLGDREVGHWEQQRSIGSIQSEPLNIGARSNPQQMSQQVAQRIVSGLNT